MGDPIVIAFPTIMDGLVLRWYWSEDDVEAYRDEFMSVSRDRVNVYCADERVPQKAAADAAWAHRELVAGRDETVKKLVTHRFKRFMGREIEPVEREQVTS